MKNFMTVMSLACAPLAASAQAPSIMPDAAIEAKVKDMLGKMTLEEKIGQMLQLDLSTLGAVGPDGDFVFDEEKVEQVFGKYKTGSILNVPGGRATTPEKFDKIISTIQERSMSLIGIPCIYGLDQNHGASYILGATLFPQNINVAATFNTDVARTVTSVCAYESRAADCPWTFCPTLDLGRDPRWPRMWENFGEDALVNAEMAKAAVAGYQGDDPNHVGPYNIAACLKHFMGYGVPYSGKDRTPAYISPQDLREKHFAPYLAGIRAGALSIMVNSSSINGMPVHANAELLTQWLKNDLGWDGVIVTDWADINNLYTREKVAKDKKEAVAMAINAGIDMSMDPYDTQFAVILKELVDEGIVPMWRIDDAAARVLRLKFRVGLFERPNTEVKNYAKFGSEDFRRKAAEAATESMVLLKNSNDILPLKPGKNILVTGPNANSLRALNGGWSYTWQGDADNMGPEGRNTIVTALADKYGEDYVTYNPGVTYKNDGAYYEEDVPDIESAVRAAEDADIIVTCVGENSYCETPGNLTDLHLSANQRDLVKALAATGKPIILVLNEGRPRIIADIEPLADAIVDVLLPGDWGADALANLLAGDADFSGRLPFTYPKEINSLSTYDYKASESSGTMAGAYDYNAFVNCQWPFGYGLSYTTFEYSDFKVDKVDFGPDDVIKASVEVTNTGNRAGKEAVLLYSTDEVASMVPDNRRLRAFAKIDLAPGEKKTVTFSIPASDLAFVGYDGKWVLEAGAFKLMAGNQVLDINCVATRKYDSPNKD